MKYFPLLDPISRVFTDRITPTQTDIAIYVNNIPAGFVRVTHDEAKQFVRGVLASQLEIAHIEDGICTWHGDYEKTHVVSEDGELVPVFDLTSRED